MNFVEAAITLLEEKRTPMHVEELCKLALERELLSRPGANPLRSMKGRLTTESRRGGAARIIKISQDTWALRDGEGGPEEPPTEDLISEVPLESAPEEASGEEVAQEAEEGEAESIEAPAPPLTPEEQELADLYADEDAETTPIAELSEYQDEHTSDEDRPMLPEIKAERRRRGAKERRPRRRDEEGRARTGEKTRERGRRERSRRGRGRARAEEVPSAEGETLSLSERAYRTLADTKSGQPVRARQLAQMMKKRGLLEEDSERGADLLRVALVADERERLGRGLRPRIIHRGRDRFALATAGLESELAGAEEAVEEAVAELESATRRALAERLGELSQPALERVVQTHLERIGYSDLEWIKRVGGASYATAVPPGFETPTLVGTRVGKRPIDRRGIGELRAGLEAKGLRRGLLISPQPLSEEAVGELEREGRPVELLCGDQFLDVMLGGGIGVIRRATPLYSLDLDFFDELG